jgi:plastocyanin
MTKRLWNLALVCASIASACAGEVIETPDVETMSSSASGFQRIEPCPTESSYVPRAVVRFGDHASFYSPPCARLASGGTVVFAGRFAEHPLEPRPFGTTFSPIASTRDGGSVEFEFPDPGFYMYGCALHPEEIGVIWASAGF